MYGRTDMGRKGMHKFFQTHKCSELCRMLRRRWLSRKSEAVNDASHVDRNDYDSGEDDGH